MEKNYDIFISYSNNDKNIAFNLCEALEQKNLTCWIAPRNVQMGSYANSIIEGIIKSKIFILIFSSSSNNSTPVLNEVELAVKNNLIIIPLRIEDFLPTKPLEYYLMSNHWFDVFHPQSIWDFEEFSSIIYHTINNEETPLQQTFITTHSKKRDKLGLQIFLLLTFSSFLFLLFNSTIFTKKIIKKEEPQNNIIEGLTIAVKVQTKELKETKEELKKKQEEMKYWKKQYLKEIKKHKEDSLLVYEAQKIKEKLGFKEALVYLEKQNKEPYLYYSSAHGMFDGFGSLISTDEKNFSSKLGYNFMDYLGSELPSTYAVENIPIKQNNNNFTWYSQLNNNLKWNHSLQTYNKFFPKKDILYPPKYEDTYISDLLYYNYDFNSSVQLSGM